MGVIEPDRVVQIRTPRGAASTGPGYRFGSGYLVAGGLVLTARHVLVRPGLGEDTSPDPGQSCEVYSGDGWVSARLEAAGRVDAAVLRASLAAGRPAVRWARLAGTAVLRWEAMGYPFASLGPERRDPEHLYGEVSPLTREGGEWLGLTVSSRVPRTTGTAASGWAGLSGAAVLCEGRIAGIIASDSQSYSRSLNVLRATAILSDPVLAAALGRPAAEDVGGRAVRRPPSLEPGLPVLLVVDDEDSQVIGEQLSDLAQVLTATSVPEALDLIKDPALRIDAALVDIRLGETSGESGRGVLDALCRYRRGVLRSVISADPFMGMTGDITGALSGRYGVYRTLRKPAPGSMTPDVRACAEAMLARDDEAVTAVVREQIGRLRDTYVRERLIPRRSRAQRSRRSGDIEETELRDAESRVERAEAAVADALAEAESTEAEAKWDVVDWLDRRLRDLNAGAG